MLLQRLKLENFLIYEDVDLDLQNVKLASIIGSYVADTRRSNGAGKTALLESIRYGLFDVTRSKAKNGIVRNGTKRAVVEIEVNTGRNHIRVKRVRQSSGGSTAQLWIDGQAAGDKIKEVNKTIVERLGIDVDLFDLIYFFKQNDQFGFAEASPADRKGVLAKVFRMNELLACQGVVREKLRLAREAAQRSKGAAEAAASRLAGMRTIAEHRDELLAVQGDLATAQQLKHEYGLIAQETRDHASWYNEEAQAWQREVEADRQAVREAGLRMQKAANDVSSAQGRMQQCQSKLSQDESRRDTAKAALGSEPIVFGSDADAEIRQLRSQHASLMAEASEHVGVINELKSKMKNAGLAGADCHTCGQFVSVDHIEQLNERTRAEIAERTAKSAEAKERAGEIQVKIDELDAQRVAAASYDANKRHLDTLESNVKESRKQLRQVTKGYDDLVAVRDKAIRDHSDASLKIDGDVYNSHSEMIDYYGRAYEKMLKHSTTVDGDFGAEVLQLEVKQKSVTIALEARQAAEAETKQADDALKNAEREERVLTALQSAFGKDGIQALIVENAIGVIEQFANEMLEQMQTRFVVELRTQKKLQSGEDRESLDIIVLDNGQERPFENYSGGERTLINLALRLSLSRVISSLHGVSMRSLFLDEVLGALDEVNREEVVKVIAFLSRSFEQVFVISHTDEIKDVIDTGIVIERHDHHSTVQLTNV